MFGVNSCYLSAMTAYRYYNYNNNMAAKALRRLSSGLRINSAADDPSGLCISERMRAQIRGIRQAKRNVQDTISMLQTADGVASSFHSMLQRAKELSVQAASDTFNDQDRKAMDTEVQEILKEIDRESGQSEFNTIKLMDRDPSKRFTAQVGPNSGDSMDIELPLLTRASLGLTDVNLLTRESASKAIDTFAKAIDRVSSARATYGATINRLEHTVNSLDNYDENLSAAESRIRDADMAKEMMNYTKYSLLSQMAQFIMAQSGQQAKNVLFLLTQSLGQAK